MKLLPVLILSLALSGCTTKIKGEDHMISEQNKLIKIQDQDAVRQKKESEDLERQRYYDEKFRKYESR